MTEPFFFLRVIIFYLVGGHKGLLSTNVHGVPSLPCIILGPRDTAMNKLDKVFCVSGD